MSSLSGLASQSTFATCRRATRFRSSGNDRELIMRDTATTTGWWYTYPSEKYESQWEGLSHIYIYMYVCIYIYYGK